MPESVEGRASSVKIRKKLVVSNLIRIFAAHNGF